MNTISWKLARVNDVDADGVSISSDQYICNDQWIDAVVPGTVFTSYEKAGLVEDPYFSDNILKVDHEYYNVDYWYRGVASVIDATEGKRVLLNFDGVNHKADVFVDGISVGSVNGAFRRGSFDITEIIKNNKMFVVAVYIHWSPAGLLDTPTFIGSAGWDFMPDIPGRNAGIYAPVSIDVTGDIVIRNPFVTSDLALPKMNKADIDVAFEAENLSDNDVSCNIVLKLSDTDIMLEKQILIPAKTTIAGKYDTFTLDNPQVWWPVGFGEHPLYDMTITAVANGTVSHTENVRFGIRKFEYDRDGHDLELTVNGVRILCKGGNWGMPDAMLKHTHEFIDNSVRLHAEAGVNMIRTWHSNSDFACFYDACDKYGVIVFEDFALHGKQTPHDYMLFMESARDKLKRLRNRCCIAIWCGENEAIPPKPLDVLLPQAINELDGTRIYIAASNCDGVHGGTTYMIQDPAWFFGHAKGFVTEIGTQTVPNIESLRRMMKPEELWPAGNAVWQHHDYDFGIGNKNSQKYTDEVFARYGAPNNIEDFCVKAQLINVETYKAIFESYNDGMFDLCSGLLLWMSAPAWPSLIWEIYDYYLDCFGAYFGTKKATEMRHVQWNARTGSVKVINHLPESFGGTVAAEVYNLDGTLVLSKNEYVTVDGASAIHVTDLFADTSVNIAVGKHGTASACENDQSLPDNAFDGGDITRWTCDGSSTGWLCVDLEKVCKIDGVRISWENAYAKDFDIEVSLDGKIFEKVAQTINGNGGLNTLMFDAVDARYVRLVCKQRGTMWNYSCYQFMVFEAGTSSSVKNISKVHFIKLRLTDEEGTLVSDNFYWRSSVNCDYKELANLPKASVECSAVLTGDDETRKAKITLSNVGNSVAMLLRVKASKTNAKKGEDDRILPAFFSDNYVSLLPGETKDIDLEYATSVYSGDLRLELSGYNCDSKKVTLKTR